MSDTAPPSSPGEHPKEDKLRAFLVKLATDPGELGRFIMEPDATMNIEGLGAEDQALLKSGNPAAIHHRLTGQPTVTARPAVLLVVDVTADGTPSIRSSYAYGGTAIPQYASYPQPVHPRTYRHPWSPPEEHGDPEAVASVYFPQYANYPQPVHPRTYRHPWTPPTEIIDPQKVASVYFPQYVNYPQPVWPWPYPPFYYQYWR
jgi:hypothetical protein